MMILPKIIFVAIALFGLGQAPILAYSKSSAEAAVLHNLRDAFELFSLEHDGRFPTNWAEAETSINVPNLNAILYHDPKSFPLELHYVFTPKGLNLRDLQSRQIILMRSEPKYDRGISKAYRFFFYVDGTNCFERFAPEKDIQEMLRNALGPLPAPDLKAVAQAKKAVEDRIRARKEFAQKGDLQILKLLVWDYAAMIKSWFVHPPNPNKANPWGGLISRLRPAVFLLMAFAFSVALFFVHRRKRS
jgi:hypothetical protein